MHLESLEPQSVPILALGMDVELGLGERIHTESSRKYDQQMAECLLAESGFALEESFLDRSRSFALHLARAV
jgi:uncharacterized SAM-dependent methyltransferase